MTENNRIRLAHTFAVLNRLVAETSAEGVELNARAGTAGDLRELFPDVSDDDFRRAMLDDNNEPDAA